MAAEGKRLFLTGATGFLGGRVLKALAHGGLPMNAGSLPQVVAGVRSPLRMPAVDGVPSAIEWQSLDLSSAIELPHDIGTVIHVAGEKRDPARMAEVNEHGTRRLVEAAAAAGVRRFVYVSSVGSYGAPADSGVVAESFPHTPRNLYESSKDAGEVHVRQVCAASGMQGVIVQPTNVIGRVDGRSTPLLGLIRMVARRRFAWFGSADPIVNYVGVDDVAAAIVAAMGARAGTYIVNTPCRLADLVGWVADELRIAAPTARLPGWLGRALAGVGGAVASATGRSMPFSPERLLELTNTTRYAPDALMRDTGFAYPSGIEKLIRELVRGYISEDLV